MSQPVNMPPVAGSERFRLARLARDAALRVPGVLGTDTGPMGLFVTVDGGQRVEGVMCMATSGDGYEVSLRLVCALVPLLTLGELVRTAVRRTAALAGIELESVSVHVAALTGARGG
jgi:hypothetical protein